MEIQTDKSPEMLEDATGEIKMEVEEKRQARKVYKCRVCGENIYQDDFYLHIAWKDEAGFHYFKQHEPGECW